MEGSTYLTWRLTKVTEYTLKLPDYKTLQLVVQGKKQLHAKFFYEGGKGNSTNTLGTTTTSYKVPRGSYTSLNTIISEAIHVENMQHTCTSTREHVYAHLSSHKIFLMKSTVHLSVLYIFTELHSPWISHRWWTHTSSS